MPFYQVYGLVLESDVQFAIEETSASEPDVTIRLQSLDQASVLAFHDGGDRIGSGVEGTLLFTVRDGTEVVADIAADADMGEVRTMLLGGIMAIVLRQRGLLALHACAVERDGITVAFMGDSGWGKSTIAEYFCQQGYRLVNDDVVALSLDGPVVNVIPGYPQIKLRDEAGRWLRKDFDDLDSLSGAGSKKGTMWTEAFAREPLPLSHLFFLEPFVAPATSIEELSPQPAIKELIRHTRVTHLITHPKYTTRHLGQCADLFKRVPCAILHRRRSLEALSEIKQAVEQSVTLTLEHDE